jgi:hypothetical protein
VQHAQAPTYVLKEKTVLDQDFTIGKTGNTSLFYFFSFSIRYRILFGQLTISSNPLFLLRDVHAWSSMWMCSTRRAPTSNRRAHFLLFLEPAPPSTMMRLHAASCMRRAKLNYGLRDGALLDHELSCWTMATPTWDNEIVRCYSAMYCVPLPRQICTTASARVDDHGDLLGYVRIGKLSASFKIEYFTTSISS